MSPASSAARNSRIAGSSRRNSPTVRMTPRSRAVVTMRSPSARVSAIGFSTSTCSPRFIRSIDTRRVQERRRRDQRRVGHRAVEPIDRGQHQRHVIESRKALGALDVRIDQRTDGDAFVPGEDRQVKTLRDRAASDDGDPDGLVLLRHVLDRFLVLLERRAQLATGAAASRIDGNGEATSLTEARRARLATPPHVRFSATVRWAAGRRRPRYRCEGVWPAKTSK